MIGLGVIGKLGCCKKGPSGPAALTPDQIIAALSPQLWHDFSDQAGADGSNITSSTDLSGNGYTLTNPGTAPVVIANAQNSKKACNFGASFADHRLQNASWPATGNSAFTIFVVHKLTTLQANTHGMIQLGSSGTGGQCLQWGLRDNAGCIVTLTDRSSNLYVQSSPDRAVNTAYIDVVRRTANATNMFRSNASTKAPNFSWTANVVGNRFCVGASSLEAVYYMGWVGEVVFFNSALSDTDVSTVETALNSKWVVY